MTPIYNFEEFKEHVIREYPNEACGFLHNNVFYPQVNIAGNPTEDFRISGHKYITFSEKGGDLRVLHSHIMKKDTPPTWYDIRTPSKQDIASQMSTNIPWGIVGTDGTDMSPEPLWFGEQPRPPFEGREFIHGVQDCLVLTLDFLNITFNLELQNCPRDVDWFEKEPLIDQNIEKWGFIPLRYDETLQFGDVVLMKVRTPFVNHLGVYLGPDKMLHHLINRLSYIDTIHQWDRCISGYARHKDLFKNVKNS